MGRKKKLGTSMVITDDNPSLDDRLFAERGLSQSDILRMIASCDRKTKLFWKGMGLQYYGFDQRTGKCVAVGMRQ